MAESSVSEVVEDKPVRNSVSDSTLGGDDAALPLSASVEADDDTLSKDIESGQIEDDDSDDEDDIVVKIGDIKTGPALE